jgi:[NiFe] hydrogenase assembly HybE family chaperone
MDAVKENLETVFNEIAQSRRDGLPVFNPALRVQAVGLREWQGRGVGVLITPWMIGLVLVPGYDAPLKALAPGEKETWTFPSGKHDFIGWNEPGLGICQTSSVISPITDIGSHSEAVNLAWELIASLFVPADVESDAAAKHKALMASAQPMVSAEDKKVMSRRDFLRGNFFK